MSYICDLILQKVNMKVLNLKTLLLLCIFVLLAQWAAAQTRTATTTQTTTQTTTTAQAPMNTNTRGATSISGSTKPLWVLNGVVLEGSIDLKPEDLVSEDAKMLIAAAIPGLTA